VWAGGWVAGGAVEVVGTYVLTVMGACVSGDPAKNMCDVTCENIPYGGTVLSLVICFLHV